MDGIANALQDVLTRYDYLMRKHQEYVEEHKQEREQSQSSLQSEQYWYAQAMNLQRLLVSHSTSAPYASTDH